MHHPLSLYNTLSRRKEAFEPVHSPFVGVYLCGPTVYSEAHLGNARGPVVFDVLTRYLRHLGYTVRYVRNITDVGHLESDADEGEDKMAKAARAQRQRAHADGAALRKPLPPAYAGAGLPAARYRAPSQRPHHRADSAWWRKSLPTASLMK